MSPGHSAKVAEAMALSDSDFRKRYRSSYETPSPSSSLTLSVWKRYRGTSELILDTDSEGYELGDEDTKEDEEDESSNTDDERESGSISGSNVDKPKFSFEVFPTLTLRSYIPLRSHGQGIQACSG
ncbi:hypothetical protein Tco_0598815 [Tanacetum coccineum]